MFLIVIGHNFCFGHFILILVILFYRHSVKLLVCYEHNFKSGHHTSKPDHLIPSFKVLKAFHQTFFQSIDISNAKDKAKTKKNQSKIYFSIFGEIFSVDSSKDDECYLME